MSKLLRELPEPPRMHDDAANAADTACNTYFKYLLGGALGGLLGYCSGCAHLPGARRNAIKALRMYHWTEARSALKWRGEIALCPECYADYGKQGVSGLGICFCCGADFEVKEEESATCRLEG